MLRTKCILLPKEALDGYRISVMSRHTLNDGVTPDLRITRDSYDLHLSSLVPPLRLLGDYYKRGLPWVEFERRYFNYLQLPSVWEQVLELAVESMINVFTLLCIEETSEYCHRRLLAEECKRLRPEIELYIR